MADKEEQAKTIAEDLVVTKYKMAGDIANRESRFPCFAFLNANAPPQQLPARPCARSLSGWPGSPVGRGQFA